MLRHDRHLYGTAIHCLTIEQYTVNKDNLQMVGGDRGQLLQRVNE